MGALIPLLAQQGSPERVDLQERAAVKLFLLDVEVTNRDGSPRPGLRPEEFAVSLDGRDWPIYSVDDLCACAAPGPQAVGPSGSPPPAARAASEAIDPVRFVLFFDFSQLQADGRELATEEAKRWVGDHLAPGQEAMVVGYAPQPGVVELCPFTQDKGALVRAIEAGYRDPRLIDAWPSQLGRRLCDCGMIPSVTCSRDDITCLHHLKDEYAHGRRSLQAIEGFLEGLVEQPGRKAVVLFNQNGMLALDRLYGFDGDRHDLASTLDEVGGTATTAHAAVFPAFAGNRLSDGGAPGALAVNFGANLADFTGGRYNSGSPGLGSLLAGAARSRCCVYRIALEPPPRPARRSHHATVRVGGQALPWRYRLRFETGIDGWFRRARTVLRNPRQARELPVAAALVPMRNAGGRWDVAVQVALNPDSLAYLPQAEGRQAKWSVGVLLYRLDGDKSWEMLALSRVRRAEGSDSAAIVHARNIEGMRPGRYRLGAFVRDEISDQFGGAEAVLELPEPGTDQLGGPILLRSGPRFVASLPLLGAGGADSTRVKDASEGPYPASDVAIPAGELLEAVTWYCPKRTSSPAPVRFVARGDEPLFRFPSAPGEPSAECRSVSDPIETSELAPGVYTYHFRWNGSDLETDFEIAPSASRR
ncbi:MAG TPA: hypothetical protein VJS92_03760 [Candidatus Polarisedimenticolaceae bacterium]|nr:hypothetical protein [Candidatus Polarisedimenticolaceae bacterium]